MDGTIAVLGATGRTGRGIARRLHEAGAPVVLVGRDAARLALLAAELPGARVVAGSFEDTLARLGSQNIDIDIVVNTVGPFERTAPRAIDALPRAHYVDLANDPIAFSLVLGRHAEATAAGTTLVTGAGFGVLATEAAALLVVEGHGAPESVRVDAMASVSGDGSPLGEALAATIIDGIASMARIPARDRRDWPGFGSRRELLVTPEGQGILCVGFPSGEFVAASRATGATSVFSGSSEAPTSRIIPFVLPLAFVLLRSARLRRSLTARLAALPWTASETSRPSWARARAEWPDGTQRVTWFRAGEGMDFTIAVASEVALRLARGEGRPGAFTPGELFGTGLALTAGGTFVEGTART
jgi:NAD(P)H-binding